MALSLCYENGQFAFSGRSLQPTREKNALLAPYGKMIRNYGIVLEMLPTPLQMEAIHQQIGNARFVRNRYLSDRKDQYALDHTTLTPAAYKKNILPLLKEAFPFLKQSDKFALEAAIEHVDDAYRRFFAGQNRFPRFVSRYQPSGNQYTTKYTGNNLALMTGSDNLPYVKLPKVGKVRFILPAGRKLTDYTGDGQRILSASIKHQGQHYTVSLQMEQIVDQIQLVTQVSMQDICGADLGIKSFGVFGNDEYTHTVENPRWIKLHEKRLRRLQQGLSRKKYDRVVHKGSKNWEKASLAVAREQRRTANQRKDFHHKLSRQIADSCHVFICEDLNIKGMMRNRHLSKAIASVGWGKFLQYVKYKMEHKGGIFLQVSRWYPSSQLCSCGYQNRMVKNLSVRAWTCPACGAYHDRDEHAMHNIVHEGLRMLRDMQVTVDPSAAA